MNKRDGAIAAAAGAMRFRERNLPPANDQDEWWDDAAGALAAADAHDAANGIHRVSLDDATVERAARKLRQRIPELIPPEAMDHVRAVLAAAVEAGQ